MVFASISLDDLEVRVLEGGVAKPVAKLVDGVDVELVEHAIVDELVLFEVQLRCATVVRFM